MRVVGHHLVIKITGTRKSMFLDPDELTVLEFNKDEELRGDFMNVSELIDNAMNTAFTCGDAIFSIRLDGEDIIQTGLHKLLQANNFNLDDTWHEACALPFLSNADPADIYDLVQEASLLSD
jgi:hypothetical protein